MVKGMLRTFERDDGAYYSRVERERLEKLHDTKAETTNTWFTLRPCTAIAALPE